MFCSNCGQSLSDDERFCHACGTKVTRADSPLQVSEGAAPVIVSENNEFVGNSVDSTDSIASPAELENDVAEILDSSGGNAGYYPPDAAAFPQTGFNPPVNAPSAALAQAVGISKPKKKRRFLPLIIAGALAAVAGAGALIWFLNTSAVLHTFMGDQNYAASVLDNYLDNIE